MVTSASMYEDLTCETVATIKSGPRAKGKRLLPDNQNVILTSTTKFVETFRDRGQVLYSYLAGRRAFRVLGPTMHGTPGANETTGERSASDVSITIPFVRKI